MILISYDTVFVGFINNDVEIKDVRFITKETGISVKLLEEEAIGSDINLSDEVVDFLLSKARSITVCSGSFELAKVVSCHEFDRDDLLKKQGAWELLQELQAVNNSAAVNN